MPEKPRPNLFIVGAMKSGTTSLHHYLSQHPDIFMSEPKEPGHFAREMDYYPKDLDWYLGLFAGAGDAKIVGDASTHYAKLPVYPGVAARIAAFNPGARIIYLMRDPIERTISHYWHNVRTFQEHRPMFEAVQRDVQYVAFSDYLMQLEPYFTAFGRERVLILTFEELTTGPKPVVRRVLDWLGVDAELGPSDFEKTNARPERFERSRGRGVMNRLRSTRVWNAVAPLVPKRLRQAATRHLAVEPARVDSEARREVTEYLRPIFQEKTAELSRALGQDFPEWRSLRESRAGIAEL